MAIEEPDFEVLEEREDYEIRRYSPYLVAEVDVVGDDPGNRAFRILAGFIFGDNQSEAKMKMTAPVISAPVDDKTTTFSFVMERKYTLDSLPEPNDERIRLLQRPGGVIAVRRYSGGWSQKAVIENRQLLLHALAEDGIETRGEPELARYDSPMKPWFLRRNEILIPVEWPEQGNQGTP
jgi:hypothetical protein